LRAGFPAGLAAAAERIQPTIWTDPSVVNGVLSTLPSGHAVAADVGFPRDQNRVVTVRQFVSGPENRLALIAIERLLDQRSQRARGADEVPGPSYNPLVLYGSPGTGKSHLARGLAAEWQRRRKPSPVVVLTAAEFAGEYAEAVEQRTVDAWRAKLREVDLFVLEDLGQIAAKSLVQTELLHTLDALADRGAVIVVTSRLAPKEMAALAPALQSRLMGGLCVPLAPPSVAARQAILLALAASKRIVLDERMAQTLAQTLEATAPELAGALAQLELLARSERKPLDESIVEQFLATRESAKPPSLQGIASQTARYFTLRVAELKSSSRRRAVVAARDVAMYLARQMTGKSLKQIGEYFGGRDHTTVLHGCRKTENLIESDPTTRLAVLELRRGLAAG
jgi:chromosomal replication initiator protein